MVAFFLQNSYPQRSLWGSIEDQYFFVLFSFVVMGAAAVFEWEMLFPDRLDFLILSPLPVQPLQLLAAKASALVIFLSIFLAGSNVFGALVLPLISKGNLLRHFFAHSVAVLMAGLFASLFFLALAGLFLCVLGATRFRAWSPMIQMLAVTALLLLMMHYAKVGDNMQALLTQPLATTRWVPSLWFLGVYELLLHGTAAPAFARPMAGYAIRGLVIVTFIGCPSLPIPSHGSACGAWRWKAYPSSIIVLRAGLRTCCIALVRRPGERAAFHFIGQTIMRNNHYQVYLAMYGGSGLALAIACAVALRTRGAEMHLSLSNQGMHAVMPLLLFWVIAGLRTAFAFPVNISAGWLFRVAGVSVDECAAAARTWVLLASVFGTCAILVTLLVAGWDVRKLVVQLVCGLCLCIFFNRRLLLLSARCAVQPAQNAR